MLFDLPLEQLQTYCPTREEPADFDQFWQQTLSEARSFPISATFTPVDYGVRLIDIFDVTYNGFGGQPVKGWFLLPHQRKEPLPCVVEYCGYGGGRGLPFESMMWAMCGYAQLVMDIRGQGSNWRSGDTPDPQGAGNTPHYPGFMTQGILDPAAYYYRRVFTDAVRAVEAARSNPAVNPKKIGVGGGSQGGGITLAVAGLVPDLVCAMPDVPFLCHFRRATSIVDSYPYQEIVQYCKMNRNNPDTVFKTLSYFDGLNFAARAKCQALFSVGLMDDVCPPSTVFAAYNHYAGRKDISIWPYNRHEGGQAFNELKKIQFLHAAFQK
jgi:cephalosporin-C deacetylase